MKAYKKQTDRPECGMVFVVHASAGGNVGGIYSNPADLRKYLKNKTRQGWVLELVVKMPVEQKRHYMVFIKKGATGPAF